MDSIRWAFTDTENVWQAFSLPATVWQLFSSPEAIAKVGFSNDNSTYQTSPKKIEIVATNDCATKNCVDGDEVCAWTTLLSIEDAGFTEKGQFRSWGIPTESRTSFRCHGVKVHDSVRDTSPGVALRDIKVWKSQ